ncbi:hypothetical protein AMTR_s00076p00063020 [Amborella trichopoda]|uniref:Uncharacterized protein n=1 Tax=Amborella trichopoda TaxID=13333 RepID=W1PC87_AMBTC|nr:hypothetical protein AMTR_s00076p00063020 [Amborella trichopoda]
MPLLFPTPLPSPYSHPFFSLQSITITANHPTTILLLILSATLLNQVQPPVPGNNQIESSFSLPLRPTCNRGTPNFFSAISLLQLTSDLLQPPAALTLSPSLFPVTKSQPSPLHSVAA